MRYTFFLSMLFFLAPLSRATTQFPVPESFKENVSFWKKIYTHYDSHQVIFFDQEDVTLIYGVLDLPKVPGEISARKYRPKVKAKYKEIEDYLKALGESVEPRHVTEDYKNIKRLLQKKNLLGQPDLAKRLRNQSGLKSQFALGLKLSGRYIDDMKAILQSQSLPTELVALVFVESLFFLSATSHAGASGPWGILKETGRRLGLQDNGFVKETFDWQKATLAAARFLKPAYEGLGSWPLAITSYNYGYAGMKRAKEAIGSDDLAIINEKHESPIYKFAAQNYYREFLGALEVMQNEQLYFPNIVKDKPKDYELVQLNKAVCPLDLYRVQAISREELADLNPSFTKKTLNGEEVIPADYSLRVPKEKVGQFYERIKKIAPEKRHAAENKISRKYRANGKESLAKIAHKLGINSDFLAKKLNKPLTYKPTGTVIIRSSSHSFSQLKEIDSHIMNARGPTEIAVQEKSKPKS